MLPGFTVEPAKPRRRRGAKPKMDPGEEISLLIDFHDLLSAMQRFTGRNRFDEADYERKADESREAFIKRTMRVVQKVHSRSSYSVQTYRVSNEPELNADGQINWNAYRLRTARLSPQVALKIAKHCVKKRVVSEKVLLYALFAHYERQTPDAIRGIIERAEADHPDIVSRIRT